MTAASLIDLRPIAKEAAARTADRLVHPIDLSVLPKRSASSTDARIEPAKLPKLEAGQIWVTEVSPTDEISTLHRTMMTTGNVIIYDRSLGAIVAEALPLGGYAEPESSAKTAQRCIQLARDGWSVVRLVDRQTSATRRLAHLRELVQSWQRVPTTGEPSVFLSAGTGQDGRRITGAGEIDRELAATIEEGDLLVVFSAIGPATASIFACTLASGLAG